jgi:hypothetical protein
LNKLRLQPPRHALAVKNQLHPLLLVKSENISMLKDRSWYQSQLNTAKLAHTAHPAVEQTTNKLLANLSTPTIKVNQTTTVSPHASTLPLPHLDQVQLQEVQPELPSPFEQSLRYLYDDL